MSLDVFTIAFIVSIVFACQTIAIFVQYRLNKAYAGLGWWLGGELLQAFGFLLMLALAMRSIWFLSAFANPLVFFGQVALNIGTRRFLGKKVSRRGYLLLVAAYTAAYYFFILAHNDIFGRSLVVLASSGAISLMTAAALLRGKKTSFAESANFTALVFLGYGCFQMLMTGLTVYLPHLGSYQEFNQEPTRVFSFIVPIVGSILWSFGLIIMVNQRLNAENLEEKEKLRLVFNMSPDAEFISRMSDGAAVDVNAGFLEMTGYTRGEVLGKSVLDTALWTDRDDMRDFVAEIGAGGGVENREFVFRHRDGHEWTGLISGRILSMQDGPHVVSVVHDITERKRDEGEIRRLLAEKELILKEVHHRIKNNMNTIYSLVSLQAGSMEDAQAVAALEETGNRIRSMMMLYETLYESSSFIDLSLGEYLPPLVDAIVANFPNAGSVRVEKHIGDFRLEIAKLQPLGIIINELLTNSMKYAFVGGGSGRITVSAGMEGGLVTVAVADDGRGLAGTAGAGKPRGFGLILVDALVGQLKGSLRIEGEGGTRISLDFPA